MENPGQDLLRANSLIEVEPLALCDKVEPKHHWKYSITIVQKIHC